MYYKGRNDDRAEKLVGKANHPDRGDSAAVKARTAGNLAYYTTPGNPGKDPKWADTIKKGASRKMRRKQMIAIALSKSRTMGANIPKR